MPKAEQTRNEVCAAELRKGRTVAEAMETAGFGEITIKHSAHMYAEFLEGAGFDVTPAASGKGRGRGKASASKGAGDDGGAAADDDGGAAADSQEG